MESGTQKLPEPEVEREKVDADESHNWSLVSPAKAGRSPGTSLQEKQKEDLHISVSKFAVLSVDDEDEEGEIKETKLQSADSVTPTSREVCHEEDEGAEEAQPDQNVGQLVREQVEEDTRNTVKGQKAKKARSQDANPMTRSTRSSCRHH